MPGAMHRMGVYLGLVEDEDYADADASTATVLRPSARRPVARTTPSRATRAAATVEKAPREYAEPRPVRRTARHADGLRASTAAPTYQITSLHPRTYNEARTIGEHFRQSTPVIMNLTEMDDADAKRLVDFAAGLTFGLHGRLERVTAKVFLLSPHNVTVTAQDKARIENGFFNQS